MSRPQRASSVSYYRALRNCVISLDPPPPTPIPGGVNSPVRAFRAVGGTPRFFAHGSGARVWDADGTAYIDYVGSWGPLIFGPPHPALVQAVQQAAAPGFSFR